MKPIAASTTPWPPQQAHRPAPGVVRRFHRHTPLIDGEERSREVFGNDATVYSFQQAVEAGATVPLFDENRTPEPRLVNPALNDDLDSMIETADLDGEEEKKLEHDLGRHYHITTRDDRLETTGLRRSPATPCAMS